MSRVSTVLLSFMMAFLFCLVLSPTNALGQEELRTWLDSTGKHAIRARLVKVEDGVVHLEKANGDSVKIAVTSLRKEDQNFANGRAAAMKNAAKKGKDAGKNADNAAPSIRNSTGDAIEISTDGIIAVEIGKSMPWKSLVQPARPFTEPGPANDMKFKVWEDDAEKNKSLVSLNMDLFRNDKSSTWFLFSMDIGMSRDSVEFLPGKAFDMENNEIVGDFENTPFSRQGASLSDDLTQVLLAEKEIMATGVSLYQMSGRKSNRSHELPLARDMVRLFNDPPQVQFAGNDYFLVTTSMEGKLATGCCQISTAKMLWMVKHENARWPLVTRDNATMIVRIDDGLAAIDIATGEQVGWARHNSRSLGTMSITPDGKRLIEVTPFVCHEIDLETGNELSNFAVLCSPLHYRARKNPLTIEWVNENRFVMISKQFRTNALTWLHLVDTESKSSVCHYQFQSKTYGGIDSSGQFRFLVAEVPYLKWQTISLPHPEMAQEIEAGMNDMIRVDQSMPIALRQDDWACELTKNYTIDVEDPEEDDIQLHTVEEINVGPLAMETLQAKFEANGFKVVKESELSIEPFGYIAENDRTRPDLSEGAMKSTRRPSSGSAAESAVPRGPGGSGRRSNARKKKSPDDNTKGRGGKVFNSELVTSVPDDAQFTGCGVGYYGGIQNMKLNGISVWRINFPEGETTRQVDSSAAGGVGPREPEDVMRDRIESIDVPAEFNRPRKWQNFTIRNGEFKRARDVLIEGTKTD